MSKIRFSFLARNLVVALLLCGAAVSLTACPTTEATYSMQERPDNHSSSGGSSGGGSY